MFFRVAVLAFAILCSSCVFAPSRKEFADVWFNLGNAYLRLGESESAARAFLKAAEYNNDFAAASFNLAKSHMLAGKFGNALEIIEKLLEEESGNGTLLSAQAYCYYKLDNPLKAQQIYRQILERNPGDFDAAFNYAVLLGQEGKDGEALELFLDLEKLDMKNSMLYFEIAKTSFNSGDYAGASSYGEKARDLDPDETEYRDFLLLAYEKGGYYAKYLELSDKIIEYNNENSLSSSNKDIYFTRCKIFLSYTGEYERGAEELEKALETGYADKDELYLLYTDRDLINISDIRKIIDASGLIKGYNPEKEEDETSGAEEESSSTETVSSDTE